MKRVMVFIKFPKQGLAYFLQVHAYVIEKFWFNTNDTWNCFLFVFPDIISKL